MRSIKYKNKDGIGINYYGNDPHKVLVREVISEAIDIINTYQMDSSKSMESPFFTFKPVIPSSI